LAEKPEDAEPVEDGAELDFDDDDDDGAELDFDEDDDEDVYDLVLLSPPVLPP
jgi:hypothetical protein